MERRKNDKPEFSPNIISREYKVLTDNYGDILEAFPDAQFTLDPPEPSGNQVIRFRRRGLSAWLGNHWKGPVYNDLAVAYIKGNFSLEEYMQFYQDIGYSVSGFLDIFNEEVDAMIVEGRVMRTGARPELKGAKNG